MMNGEMQVMSWCESQDEKKNGYMRVEFASINDVQKIVQIQMYCECCDSTKSQKCEIDTSVF